MKLLKKIIIFIILVILIMTIFFVYKGYKLYSKEVEKISLEEKIKEIKSDENYTNFENLPKFYIDAVIAVEDHRFYKHGAIDLISIGRAIWIDIKNWELLEGGSTITQQLSKNTYFTQNKKIERKIAETIMAFKMEKELSKNEIFELYVNTSYFGDGYYNIKEAASGYYNKKTTQLNEYEASMLAGIPNAPSVYAPTKNPNLATQRQVQVLDKMVKYRYITEEQKNEILKK